MATQVKKAQAQVPQSNPFKAVDMASVTLMARSRDGKPMSPVTAALVKAVLALKVGQGIKIPSKIRVEKEIVSNGKNGTIYTYTGAPTVRNHALRQGVKLYNRRDTNGDLWVFRVKQEESTKEPVASSEPESLEDL